MRGTLKGSSLDLLEGSNTEAARRLGISQTQSFQARKKGLIKPSTKTAKAITGDKFVRLAQTSRILRLTARQRLVFELIYYERLTVRATAKRLGISPVGVSDHLGRARLKLIGWPSGEKVRALSSSPSWERLTELQKRLLTLRYGLGGLKPQSYGEIGQIMKRSENWATQAMVFSLNKLLFDE